LPVRYFAVDMVNIKVSVLEGGDVETDDIFVVRGGPSVSGTGRRRRTGMKPSLAVASRPCRYSWALEVSELRRGCTTSVLKKAKVCGLAKIDKCSSEKLWKACAQ